MPPQIQTSDESDVIEATQTFEGEQQPVKPGAIAETVDTNAADHDAHDEHTDVAQVVDHDDVAKVDRTGVDGAKNAVASDDEMPDLPPLGVMTAGQLDAADIVLTAPTESAPESEPVAEPDPEPESSTAESVSDAEPEVELIDPVAPEPEARHAPKPVAQHVEEQDVEAFEAVEVVAPAASTLSFAEKLAAASAAAQHRVAAARAEAARLMDVAARERAETTARLSADEAAQREIAAQKLQAAEAAAAERVSAAQVEAG